MKIVGLITNAILGVALVSFFVLLNVGNSEGEFWSNFKYFSLFYALYFIAFFKIIRIDKYKVVLYRPFWFFFDRNSLKIDEISHVVICANNNARGVSTGIDIYLKEDGACLSFLIQLYKFEVRSMAKKLESLGVTTEVMGLH